MVVNGNHIEDNMAAAESSSSGHGPPKLVPLALQRKVPPIDSNLPDVPIVFVLGNIKF